jgi:tetratricopeptide (TPR) repeat protein
LTSTLKLLRDAYANSERTNEAIEILKQALRLDPKVPFAHRLLACLMAARYDEAIEVLNKVLVLQPDHS